MSLVRPLDQDAGRSSCETGVHAPSDDPLCRQRRLSPALLALAAFAVAFTLYALTADGGPQWQDSGEMQIRILTGQRDNWRGLALIHAPHYYLGRLALELLPGVEPARAITTIGSGLPAAIGIGCVVAAIALVTRSCRAAIVGGATLMLAHTYWQHATVTECYGVTMACFGVEWLCLAQFARTRETRWLAAMAAANGFGITNHMLAALATPALAGVAIWAAWRGKQSVSNVAQPPSAVRQASKDCVSQRKKWGFSTGSRTRLRLLSIVALAWLAGLAPYLAMIAAKSADAGVVTAVKSALVGDYGPKALNMALAPRDLALAAGYIAYNFPNFALPLALIGLLSRRWPGVFRWAIAAQLAIFLIFAVRYQVPDAYAFFFPAYMAISLLAGLGFARLASGSRLLHAAGVSPASDSAFGPGSVGPPSPTAEPLGSAESASGRSHGSESAAARCVTQSLVTKIQPRQRGSPLRRLLIVSAIISAFWQPLVYVTAAHLFRSRGLFSSLVGAKPYRDGYAAFFLPWGCARDYAWKVNDRAFELAGQDGLILLEDEMAEFGLPYSQITRGASRGVTIHKLKYPENARRIPLELAERSALVHAFLREGKPVVLIPRDRDHPSPEISGVAWRRIGDLYVAIPTGHSP